MNRTIAFACVALGLAACAPIHQPVAGAFQRPHVDLVSASYAAADTLVNQPGAASVRTDAPLLVASLANVDEIDTSSSFGRIVSDQISSRLAQTGYTVSEARLRGSLAVNPEGEFMLSRDARDLLQKQYNAQAVVTGTYAVGARNVFVSLRLVRLSDAKVLAAFDYSLPNGLDMRELFRPAAPRLSDASTRGTTMR